MIEEVRSTIGTYWVQEMTNFNQKTVAVSLLLFITVIAPTLTTQIEAAQEHMRQLNLLGIDIDAIAQNLQKAYLQASEKQFRLITQHISQKREQLEAAWQQAATHPV